MVVWWGFVLTVMRFGGVLPAVGDPVLECVHCVQFQVAVLVFW
jgi:hypothetical protein